MTEPIQYFDEPAVLVEIAWTDNYAEPFPTWTDITDYVEGFNSNIGRNAEIGSVEAGTVDLILDNTTGAFTPGNANSPFYPSVRPRRQVRVRIDDGTTPSQEGAVLTNLFPNPLLYADTSGMDINESGTPIKVSDTSFSSQGLGVYVGNSGTTTFVLTDHGNGFACSPGDYLSGTFAAYFSGFADTGPNDSTVDVTLHYYDATGTEISSASVFTANPVAYRTEVYADYANVVVPAGAVTFKPIMTCVSTALIEAYRPSVYNHGATAFDWNSQSFGGYVPDGKAQWFMGNTPADDALAYAWVGEPHDSASIAYVLPEPGSVLARGYVERWPSSFNGPTSEVTVPLVDWTSDFVERGLTPPFNYEIERRTPVELFKFNDGEDGTTFAEANDPTRVWVQYLAYPETGDVYTTSGNPVPSIAGGNESILPKGLIDQSSIRPKDQSVYVQGADTYYLGAALRIDLPRITTATDSFTFLFAYKWYADLSNLKPYAFILKAHENNYGIAQIGYVAEPGGIMYLRIWDTAGVEWSVPINHDANDTPVMGFSWDATGQNWRHISQGDVVTNPTIGRSDLTGSNVPISDVLAGLEFDCAWILGYDGRGGIGGFADHAMQWFTRYDKALTSSDLQEIINVQDGLFGQSVNDRMNYILDMIGHPRELRHIDPSISPLERAGWEDGTPAQDWLQSAATSGLGVFYVDRGGLVRYDSRYKRAKAQVAWTLDHDAGTGVEAGLTFTSADSDIVNASVIDNAYGIKTTILNDASVLEFGRKERTYELHLADQEEAVQYGYHMAMRYGEPQVRIDAVTVNPSASAYGLLWEFAKGVQISDRVRLAGLPTTAPADTMDFFVERVSHDVIRDGDRLVWKVTLNLSPAEMWNAWVLGDPEKSILGTSTIPFF